MKTKLGILLPLLSVLLGCGPTQQARPLDAKTRDAKSELYEQHYRTGGVKVAEQALLDSLELVEDAEKAGIPFWDPAGERCRSEVRLVLMYEQLGNTNLAARYPEQLAADYRQCSLKHGDISVVSMTQSQLVYCAMSIETQAYEHLSPKWRSDLVR